MRRLRKLCDWLLARLVFEKAIGCFVGFSFGLSLLWFVFHLFSWKEKVEPKVQGKGKSSAAFSGPAHKSHSSMVACVTIVAVFLFSHILHDRLHETILFIG
jgi:hypothetical protein